jgi:hypothetical protein
VRARPRGRRERARRDPTHVVELAEMALASAASGHRGPADVAHLVACAVWFADHAPARAASTESLP